MAIDFYSGSPSPAATRSFSGGRINWGAVAAPDIAKSRATQIGLQTEQQTLQKQQATKGLQNPASLVKLQAQLQQKQITPQTFMSQFASASKGAKGATGQNAPAPTPFKITPGVVASSAGIATKDLSTNLAKGAVQSEQTTANSLARLLPGGQNDLAAEQQNTQSNISADQFIKNLQSSGKITPAQAANIQKEGQLNFAQNAQNIQQTAKSIPTRGQAVAGALGVGADILAGGLPGIKGAGILPKAANATIKTGSFAAPAGLNAAAGGGDKKQIVENTIAGAAFPLALSGIARGARAADVALGNDKSVSGLINNTKARSLVQQANAETPAPTSVERSAPKTPSVNEPLSVEGLIAHEAAKGRYSSAEDFVKRGGNESFFTGKAEQLHARAQKLDDRVAQNPANKKLANEFIPQAQDMRQRAITYQKAADAMHYGDIDPAEIYKSVTTTPFPTAEEPLSETETKMNEAGGVPIGELAGNVQDMITKHQAVTKATGDIEHDYAVNQGETLNVKDDVANSLKSRAPLTSDDKTAIQDYRDAKASGVETPALPSHLQQANDDITALNKAAQENDAAKARLTGDEAKAQTIEARDPSTYTHRIAQDKGTSVDYLLQGNRDNPLSVSSLSKTTSSSKKANLMAATDETGNRRIINVNKGKVTALDNGGKDTEALGNLNLKTNSSRMESELKPVNNQIDSLQREQKILSSTKSRSTAATQRLANIKDNLQEAYRNHAAITNKYDLNDLDNKTFTGKDGHTYTISRGGASEITKATGQKYISDPELTSHLNYADSKVSLENTRFVENTKKILEDKNLAFKEGETAPKNFKPTNNPYFRGYKLDPKLAEQLNDITGSAKDGNDLMGKTSNILKQTIVYLPIKHDFNMAAGYAIDRGLSSLLNPAAYARMGKSLATAAKSVATHDEFYQNVQKSGFKLMGADDKKLGRVVAKQLKDTLSTPARVGQFAKAFGMSPVRAYKALQHVSVYDVQDVLNLARINERTQNKLFTKGQSLENAIKDTAKTNFQYKVPSRVAGSRTASKVLSGRTPLTFFGNYTYDKYRIGKNIVKSAANVTKPKEAIQAADKLAATVAISAVLWPLVDKGLQKVTGNKNAHITAPGVASIPEKIQQVAQGKTSPTAAAGSQISVAAPITMGSQLLNNQDSFTGKPIRDINAPESTQAKQTLSFLGGQLAPSQKLATVKNSKANKGLSTFLSLAGASIPKNAPTTNKLDSLKFDSLPGIQSAAKAQGAKGDLDGAKQTIAQYDKEVLAAAKADAKAKGQSVPTVKSLIKGGYFYQPKQSTIKSWQKPKKTVSGAYTP